MPATAHPFFTLRDQLPLLQFDPEKDISAPSLSFLKDYLDFYQLEFSQEISSKHFIGTFDAGGYRIVAHYWLPTIQPAKGTVFILHGYYDHVGVFQHLIRFMLEQGYVVVAYDQPGHGLSSGEQVSIRHFSEYVTVLEACLDKAIVFSKPWLGMGQSTGGTVFLHMLMVERIANPFKGIVLLAPLIKPVGWNSGIWLYRLLSPFVKKIPRHYNSNSNDARFVEFSHYHDPLQAKYLSVTWVGAMKEWLESFPSLQPVSFHGLLIQGEGDLTVEWLYNLALIKQKVNGLEFFQLPGARHHLVNERTDLRQQIFTRIRQFLLASR